MKLPSIPYLLDVFTQVLRRFPLVMLSATVGVVAAIMLIDNEISDKEKVLPKLLMTASLGLPLLISAAVASEKWRLEQWKKWLPTLAAVLGLAIYFFTLDFPDNEPGVNTMIRYAGLSLFAHLLVAYLPYLDATPVEDFWEYNKRLFGNFVVGVFYSGVIFAGLAIAILAVDNLFDLRINEKIYGHLFVLVGGIFNTAFFLANFPVKYEGIAEAGSPYNAAIKNLSKFILIPIVGIYFLILYAYSFKILATWNLPKGWVSSLVLGFSIAGIFTYLLNYLLVKFDNNKLVTGYRKWFFFVLLPMVGLLFVGIGKRINDYGITEERFVVATAGIWLLLMSLYFIFSKKDNIKFIPISLSVFALLTVLGPLNAFRLAGKSQMGVLKNLLEKNGMLADGQAVPAKDSLTTQDAESIRSILYYMREHGHLEKVRAWFPSIMDTTDLADWNTVENMVQLLKVDYGNVPSLNCGFYFQQGLNTEIVGYERLWHVQAYTNSPLPQGQSGFVISQDSSALEYIENGEKLEKVDLQKQLEMLMGKYACYGNAIATEDAVFEVTGTGHDFKLVLQDAAFLRKERPKITNWSGLVLVGPRTSQ